MSYFRFKSRDLPATERLSTVQDRYAAITRMDIDTQDETPLDVDLAGLLLPNLSLMDVRSSTLVARRKALHIADGNDNWVLHIVVNGHAILHQAGGEEVICGPGEAYLAPNDVAGRYTLSPDIRFIDVTLPRALVAPRIMDPDAVVMKKIGTAARTELRFLLDYARTMLSHGPGFSDDMAALATTHVHDLALLALGAEHDHAHAARNRGARAARLKAVKDDIAAHLLEEDLSIATTAGRIRLSPQYIRALMREAGTTFGDYVTERRLAHVHRNLCNPLHVARSISTLAFEGGFNNLSWFNRAFKRRYGMTPGEARENALLAGIADPWSAIR